MDGFIVTEKGRTLLAQVALGDAVGFATHLAFGSGDETFTDPDNPPDASADQTALLNELCRKRYTRRCYLEPSVESDPTAILYEGAYYKESNTPTKRIGVFFHFTELEGNVTVKEVGLFGGGVRYIDGHQLPYAINGVYDVTENPDGQVADPGYLIQVATCADLLKASNNVLELFFIYEF